MSPIRNTTMLPNNIYNGALKSLAVLSVAYVSLYRHTHIRYVVYIDRVPPMHVSGVLPVLYAGYNDRMFITIHSYMYLIFVHQIRDDVMLVNRIVEKHSVS